MALSFWVQLVLAGIVGILALVDASVRQGTTAASIAFLVFLGAIAYGFYMIKRAFDRSERERHRDGN